MNDSMETTETQPEKNRGGAAPADRQCRRILENGERCRDWEIRGQGFCFRHGRWEGTRRKGPITVPLLEDAGSIQMVISQTVRAMSLGTMPPSNGRVILMGCREARGLLHDRLAERRLAAQMQRWKVVLEDPVPPPMEVVDHAGDWLAPEVDEKVIRMRMDMAAEVERIARERARELARNQSPDQARDQTGDQAHEHERVRTAAVGAGVAPETTPASESEPAPAVPDELDELGGLGGLGIGSIYAEGEKPVELPEWTEATAREERLEERWDAGDPPEPDPLWVPDPQPQFRDLKKHWDMAVRRVENEHTGMFFPAPGESHAEYRESLARPYEAYFEKPPGEG